MTKFAFLSFSILAPLALSKPMLSESLKATKIGLIKGKAVNTGVNVKLFGGADEMAGFSPPLQKTTQIISRMGADSGSRTRSASDAALYKSVSPAVVLVVSEKSLGSGSLIDTDGTILTNWHVVDGAKEVMVVFKPTDSSQKISQQDLYPAKIIKVDQVSDLALLKVSKVPKDRTPIRLGESSEVNVGIDAHAIGHPDGNSWSYTKGVISQIRPEFEWSGDSIGQVHKADVIQMQTPINPGNSGGPLLSEGRNLIGVNSFKKAESEGVNYAVSIEEVTRFLRRKGDRWLKKPKTPLAKKCEPKKLHEGRTEDGSGNVLVFDLNCTGRADLDIIYPDDKTKPVALRYDTNRDGAPDRVYLDLNRDEKVELSFWDNDFDGEFDLVGYHENGEVQPTQFQDYKEFVKE